MSVMNQAEFKMFPWVILSEQNRAVIIRFLVSYNLEITVSDFPERSSVNICTEIVAKVDN